MHNSCILKKEGFGRLRLDTGLPDDKLRQFCEGSDNLSAETLDLLSMHFLNAHFDAELDALRPNWQPVTPMAAVGYPPTNHGQTQYPPVATHVGAPPAQLPGEGVFGIRSPRPDCGRREPTAVRGDFALLAERP